MRFKKRYILYTYFLALCLLAVGCANDPVEESSAETSGSQVSGGGESSEVPESSEEASSFEESIAISMPEESSMEESAAPLPVYRNDEEPKLEDIKLPAIAEQGFAFLQSKLTMELGSNTSIPFEFTPIGTTDKTLAWTSSNEKAVTVSADGKLTAVGPGVSYIRAETPKGNYAECRVEVVEELPLSPIAALIKKVTSGNLKGRQFALYDVNMDGTAELLTRKLGENGLPVVDILDASSGESLLFFETGSDEEWAVWEREGGSRFVLISFSQPMGDGAVRYVVDELTVCFDEETKEERLCIERVLVREALTGGSVYYARIDGEFVSCENDTYQSVRSVYFGSIKQFQSTHATWVSGTDFEEIAKKLKEPSVPPKT